MGAQTFRRQNAYKTKKSSKTQSDAPMMRAAEQEWLQEDPIAAPDDSSPPVDENRPAKQKFDWRSRQLRYNAQSKADSGVPSSPYPPRRIRPSQVTVEAGEPYGRDIALYHER